MVIHISDFMFSIDDKIIFERTGHVVSNRTVLAAMTNKQSHEDGTLSDNEIKWLTRRAKGGFGIVTTAATHVSKDGQGWDGEFGVFDDIHLSGLTELAKSLKENGALSIAQIFHGGMRSPQRLTGVQPISASKNKCEESDNGFSRPASEEDIYRLIHDFTAAAIRCSNSGFDGIELHGAHGYLICQFLGSKTNTRTDSWGGDICGRAKFLLHILRSIKSNVPDDFIIGVRISPEIEKLGINLHESIELTRILRDEGIDFLHLSCWNSFSRAKCEPEDPRFITEWFTDSVDNLPLVISTGGVWNFEDAKSIIKQGADFVGVARVGIAHPDWPKHITQEEYNPQRPPFTTLHLKEVELSDIFIDYMRAWDNFVKIGK
jgi:2,4-dienoyl-CoA reductase-like NADH-dependent reductase (Old Yellow Enzyme family)|tara:strand:+ start:1185 stop:2309 length:1125 start_codon:yes stop_codon:yes gene_type:complete